jgi:hypothetical protein
MMTASMLVNLRQKKENDEMNNKTPVIWLIAGLVTALAIIISGCSTKKPWSPSANVPLVLSIVSGPADSAMIPFGSSVTYSWTSKGGTGEVQYQYNLDNSGWSALSRSTAATFSGFETNSTHTVSIQAADASGGTQLVTRLFMVGSATPDTIPPIVFLTQAPEESSFVAVGSVIPFAWDGFDSSGTGNNLLFRYVFNGDTSAWAPVRTVSFENVTAANPAIFTVWAQDLSSNHNNSAPMTVTFVIRNATVLYIDDYQWLDSFGNVDRAKEREQKQFYRDILRGYAFAEWDNDVQGHSPTMTDLAGFTTIVWAADADNGCSPEPNYRLYFDVGAVHGGVLKSFIDAGGHLLLTGPQTLNYIYNTIPPAPTDFEAAYLGVSDTVIVVIDTTTTPPETTLAPTWQYSSDFTWAIKEPGVTGYPDSMKIDVAKNGAQVGCDASLLFVRHGVTPIFKVGLDVNGDQPGDYGMPCGWTYAPGGPVKSATLEFDTFSEGEPAMRQTFHTILEQFGEGPGL